MKDFKQTSINLFDSMLSKIGLTRKSKYEISKERVKILDGVINLLKHRLKDHEDFIIDLDLTPNTNEIINNKILIDSTIKFSKNGGIKNCLIIGTK